MIDPTEAESVSTECTVCGRPTKADFAQCSVSCNLASKIPLEDGGSLPATWSLGGMLISAFVLFNQFMFWSLFWVKQSQGAVELGDRFEWGSIIIGSLWLGGALWAWGISQPKRFGDAVIALMALLVVFTPRFVLDEPPSVSGLFSIANFLIACRLYRGGIALWQSSKKKEK
jgi:hypothetical protein|tara:strand:- start:325 stop:840 length:516 start_codon:yes stop_codon:yes gene_type:complete